MGSLAMVARPCNEVWNRPEVQNGHPRRNNLRWRGDMKLIWLWEKGPLGGFSAESLMYTTYFYNGKLFGLRAGEHPGGTLP